MKYFFDTEFIEYPCTIDLISIGIVAEDGREFYAVSSEFDESKASDWVREHVIPILGSTTRQPRHAIAAGILDFMGYDLEPVFWGWYADYDWVVLCWLYGTMMHKPLNFPSYCKDIKQLEDSMGIKAPRQLVGNHNALDDARWNKSAYDYIISTNDYLKRMEEMGIKR